MPELLEKPLNYDSKTPSVSGIITEGDRNNRFWLSLQDGSTTLNVADDIAKQCIIADKLMETLKQVVEQSQKNKELLTKELNKTEALITRWLEEHKDRIIYEKTGFVGAPIKTSDGIVRCRFLVTQKSSDAFVDEDLDNELTALEERILKEIKPQLVRIDTILLPDINANLSNIDA
jgi:hypothetical protein